MRPTSSDRIRRLIHDVVRQLASVKLGLLLLIACFAFTLVAAFFPVQEVVGFVRTLGNVLALEDLSAVSQLNFQERFESPPFLVLIGVLSLSLCFSLYFRIRGELKRARAKQEPALLDGVQRPGGLIGTAVNMVEQELRRRRYNTRTVRIPGNWEVHASKGGSGVWGSVLFHVSLLLVLAAVVLGTSLSFRASVNLTEGQAFDARVDKYGKQSIGRWYQPAAQPLTFRLVRVDPDYDVNGQSTLASLVVPTLEGKSTRFSTPTPVYINHGLRHAGVTIHQGRNFGFAPQLIIEDAAGKRVFEGYASLATLSGPEKESYLDRFDIGSKDKQLRAELELFPDAVYRNGVYLSKSALPKNPVLRVVLREDGKIVLDQFIRQWADASGGGYAVHFGSLRRWSQIDLSDAPGVPVLLVATLLGSLGLALRLLGVRRRILVVLPRAEPGQAVAFHLSGTSEKYQRTFEAELGVIRAALTEQLATLTGASPPVDRLVGDRA